MSRMLKGVVVLAALLATPAMAQDGFSGPYVSLSAGAVSTMDNEFSFGGSSGDIEYDIAPFFSAAAGYDFGQFRAEIEGSYSSVGGDEVTIDGMGSVSLSDAEADVITVTVNVFYDIDTGTSFSPYVGAGIGVARTDVDDFTVGGVSFEGDTDTSLAALGELGVGIAVTDTITIAPSYRFLWINNGDNGFEDDKAHIFKLGARFGF